MRKVFYLNIGKIKKEYACHDRGYAIRHFQRLFPLTRKEVEENLREVPYIQDLLKKLDLEWGMK